jgi:hypothetical protein
MAKKHRGRCVNSPASGFQLRFLSCGQERTLKFAPTVFSCGQERIYRNVVGNYKMNRILYFILSIIILS